jgi:DTW domain-containing protein YfiP
LCELVQPVSNQVQVLVLQHPSEQRQAKGTARLLALSLQRCELRVGEQFAPDTDTAAQYSLLLYPSSPADPMLPAAPVPDIARLTQLAQLRLIVLDGTWRKSRKLLHQNPWLQDLPRLSLQDLPAPAYRIRRAHAEHQLSTLEAVACALQQLEGRPAHWQPLWLSFEAFIARELERRHK